MVTNTNTQKMKNKKSCISSACILAVSDAVAKANYLGSSLFFIDNINNNTETTTNSNKNGISNNIRYSFSAKNKRSRTGRNTKIPIYTTTATTNNATTYEDVLHNSRNCKNSAMQSPNSKETHNQQENKSITKRKNLPNKIGCNFGIFKNEVACH